MKLEVYKKDGTKTGESIDLSKEIFEIEPNDHVLYLAVKAYMANQRQGTHKAKERSEVRGGGKKPRKQKGGGGARVGTTRSPLWVGGGSIFGPKPRSYRQKLNKKVYALARKSALSYKAKANQILIIEDFDFENAKTKEFVSILNALNLKGKRTLFLTDGYKKNIYMSGRNVEKVNVLEANNASAYDLVNNQILLLQKSAVNLLESTIN